MMNLNLICGLHIYINIIYVFIIWSLYEKIKIQCLDIYYIGFFSVIASYLWTVLCVILLQLLIQSIFFLIILTFELWCFRILFAFFIFLYQFFNLQFLWCFIWFLVSWFPSIRWTIFWVNNSFFYIYALFE